MKAIGFIGSREAGFRLSKGLGGIERFAFDIHVTSQVLARASEAGVTMVTSSAAMVEAADAMFSEVTAGAVRVAARVRN